MVKLEPIAKVNYLDTVFYFRSMADCEAFLRVFKDHWCNVPWKKPVEAPDFPDMSKFQRDHLDDDPKQKADRHLAWGFGLVRYHGIEDTPEQKTFVKDFAKQLNL